MSISIADKVDLNGITDNFKYATLAFVIDRKAFIKRIQKARVDIGLSTPMTYQDARKWLAYKYEEHELSKMNEVDKKHLNQSWRLQNTIGAIKRDFRMGLGFDSAIMMVVLAGTVTDQDFDKTSFCVEYPFPDGFEDTDPSLEQPLVAIFVSPQTRLDEIKHLLDTEVVSLFNKMGREKEDKKEFIRIKRDREWYWEYKYGEKTSYLKIWKVYKGSDRPLDKEGVRKAIERYERRVATDK